MALLSQSKTTTQNNHLDKQQRRSVEANIGAVATPCCISCKEYRTGDSVEKKAERRLLKSSFRIRRVSGITPLALVLSASTRKKNSTIHNSNDNMQQSTTTTKVTLFYTAHQEALALDLGILEKLLRSNRAAQRRTKYYQRLDMACRCIRKHNILNLYQDYQQLSTQVTEVVERKRKQKKRQQVFWDLELAGKTDEKNQQETQQVKQEIEAMRKRISANVPETVDRLEYASEALFKEMARGFFLSFCSVAAACIARIRVLLQNLASQILYEWPAWEKGLVEVFGKAIESAVAWEADSMTLLRESFHPPKSSFLGDSKRKDQVQDLLHELGVDIKVGDGMSQEGDASENEETIKLQSALDKPGSKSRDEDEIIDFGERLTSHGAEEDEEIETAPDYMAAAVSQIQGNLALSKKAKAAKKAKTPPSSSSKSARKIGSEKKTGSDVKLSRQKDGDKKRDSDSSAVKQKKKKRKDFSSKSQSSKKSKKSSGEFFDNLFK